MSLWFFNIHGSEDQDLVRQWTQEKIKKLLLNF